MSQHVAILPNVVNRVIMKKKVLLAFEIFTGNGSVLKMYTVKWKANIFIYEGKSLKLLIFGLNDFWGPGMT